MPKKITGRTKQLSLKTTPGFHAKLKELAVKEKCLMIEILEQALDAWEKQHFAKNASPMDVVIPTRSNKHYREDEKESSGIESKKRKISSKI